MILSIPGSGTMGTGTGTLTWVWVRVQVLHVKSHGYGSKTGSVGTGTNFCIRISITSTSIMGKGTTSLLSWALYSYNWKTWLQVCPWRKALQNQLSVTSILVHLWCIQNKLVLKKDTDIIHVAMGGSKKFSHMLRGGLKKFWRLGKGGQKSLTTKIFNCPAPHQSIYEHSLRSTQQTVQRLYMNMFVCLFVCLFFFFIFFTEILSFFQKKNQRNQGQNQRYQGNMRRKIPFIYILTINDQNVLLQKLEAPPKEDKHQAYF